MAFDGLMVGFVVKDIKADLNDAKIEKVQQPEPDRIILSVTGKKKLLLDASSQGCRVQFTDLPFENPLEAPSFCMLLRKHLQGNRILSIDQVEDERIIDIVIETIDEIGYSVNKRLIIETMGKHSNIILVDDSSGKIIDSIRRVPAEVNRYRRILPGITYVRPPKMDDSQRSKINAAPAVLDSLAMGASLSDFEPSVYLDEAKKPKDYHVIPLVQYEGVFERIRFENITQMLDYYYTNKTGANRVKQKAENLTHTIQNIIDKQLLKKQRLLEEIKRSEEADIYRIKGELLNANLHLVKAGDKKVNVTSFYDGTQVEISLDEKLSPAKNAQSYFKKYTKAKGAKKEKLPQLKACEEDIEYLESLKAMVLPCNSYEELEAIHAELADGGYIRVRKASNRNKKNKPKPRMFTLSSGLKVAVGRNNMENDYVTFKLGAKDDWWFHTKDIHGSHVVMLCEHIDPSPEDMYEAAAIAAWFSQAKDSENVPVDYAPVRKVKKPNGAKPGMVVFSDNGTVYINPKEPR